MDGAVKVPVFAHQHRKLHAQHVLVSHFRGRIHGKPSGQFACGRLALSQLKYSNSLVMREVFREKCRYLPQAGRAPIFIARAATMGSCGVFPPHVALPRACQMTKLSFGAHPFLLGFDQLERLVERTAKSGSDGYPPFNIEQSSENAFRITLAVAGFREPNLAITVEDRQLVIRGRQADEDDGRIFLHRGIAARAFQRSFVLAEGVDVDGAAIENGLLHIDLKRAVPEPVVRKIDIERK